MHYFLSAKNTTPDTEKQHELDKRKNPAKVKVEHGSFKDRKNVREPHKKDQKETENSETTKKTRTKQENEPNEEKVEVNKDSGKSDHVEEGSRHILHFDV